MRVIKKNVGVILQRKLLPVCMAVVLVMGLVSGGGLTARAAVSDKYQVGGVFLDMSGVTSRTGWTWNGTTKTLTFTGNTTIATTGHAQYTMVPVGLPAGSTIVINSGVTVTLRSNEADGLFCEGDLTVKGTGRLNCYGSASGLKYNRGTSPATGYAGDDSVSGDGMSVYGSLKIGDNNTKTGPYIYTRNEAGAESAITAMNRTDPQIAIYGGTLEIPFGKVIRTSTGHILRIYNNAKLIYPYYEHGNITIAPPVIEDNGTFYAAYNVYFVVKNGKWDDGTDATKVVKVGPTTQFRLPYDKIPEAGTMPNAGYSPGRWSKIPDTTTIIRSGTTYTYTYWSAAGAAFETVKTAKIADVDRLAKADDNAVCRNLIADAKDEIDEYVYEDEMTQEQNTAVLDEIEDRLKRDLSFERERAAKIAEVEGLAKSGDNDECKKLIADAKTALESYFYDEDKTLDNNKAALQVIVNELKQKLPAERIKAAKIAKIAEVEALAKADDSDASKKLIADAKAALEAYEYDDSKTEAENIAALEAIVSKLKTDIEKQREADKPQTDDNTVINPDGTKTVTKVRKDSKGSIEIVVTTYDKADKAISEYVYQLAKSGTLDLKKVSVNNKKAVIPDTVKADGKTYKVTRLKKGFMKKCKKVTAVDVGKNVNTIDKNALTGANKVKTVTIRSKLKKVGKGAFKVMKKGTIKMNVSKKVYQKNLKLIEKSGISDNVKIKRVKGKK